MKIKNWTEFQHFKDRTPPWIKLYRHLLDDPDWHELSGDEAKTLMMLWLLASEDKNMDGNLPSIKNIAFRLRITEKQLNQYLVKLKHWLILDDINVISELYQHDAPETETERETKKRRSEVKCPESVDENIFKDFLIIRKEKRQPLTETALNGIVNESKKAGISLNEAITICCENGWAGFKSSWLENMKSKQVAVKETFGWRNDDTQILQMANKLGVYTSGKSRFEILAAIDKKRGAQ